MDYGDLADKLNEFIQTNSENPKDLNVRDLGDFLYWMDETYNWPDSVESLSQGQAILCWRIIEALRKKEMPKEFRRL